MLTVILASLILALLLTLVVSMAAAAAYPAQEPEPEATEFRMHPKLVNSELIAAMYVPMARVAEQRAEKAAADAAELQAQ